ncbi:replication initiation protein [Bacillus phage Moonbeam]|uniref:DUF5405 domain-containing protein n=1 Tax=Bacillus phage Moonbeam TaxID=1540091 RepID=A0A0A0RNG4_9CAUD|nr:replication initiation protein [Bacillus phage Moonbeam]AIW03542.1 hypothetical protein CPT_Moonbeam144 [Bacillus phage Moonbeam]
MNIQLNENYKLTSDQHNVILNRKNKKKEDNPNTEDTYSAIAFYPNLEQACNGLIDKEIRLSEATSIEQLVNDMTKLKDEIVVAIKESGGK